MSTTIDDRKVLLRRDQIIVTQDLFQSSLFLSKIVDFAFAYINAKDEGGGKFLFVQRIMIPLINGVFQQGKTPLPTEIALNLFLEKLTNDWSVSIVILPGECTKSAFAQTGRDGSRIHFNVDWIVRADYALQLSKSFPFTDANTSEANVHIIVGFIKVLHEIAHTFMPTRFGF